MYALTWSSSETIMFKPYFFTLRDVLAMATEMCCQSIRREVFGGIYATLEKNGVDRILEELRDLCV